MGLSGRTRPSAPVTEQLEDVVTQAHPDPLSVDDIDTAHGELPDRTSTHTMRANQLRLYFSSFAYVLMHALRRLGAEGTELARAQCSTLRLKLLKIGARIRITARRVWLSFSQAYPYAATFTQVLANLHKEPLWNPSG